MTDERIHTLVGIPPKELDMLKRKAAAFDAIAKHQLIVHLARCSDWYVFNRFHKKLTERHAAPLEAVEAAVKKLGET